MATATKQKKISKEELDQIRQICGELFYEAEAFRATDTYYMFAPMEVRIWYFRLIAFVHERSDREWPRNTWKFLEQLLIVCRFLINKERAFRGGDISPSSMEVNSEFTKHYPEHLVEMCSYFDQSVPPVDDRLVPFETLDQLDRLNIDDVQIARMYEWTDDNGTPDANRVKLLREGKAEPPEPRVLPGLSQDGHPRELPDLFDLTCAHRAIQSDRCVAEWEAT